VKIIFSLLFLLALASLNCAGNKPMVSQIANADDDPKCKEFYEAIEDVSKDFEKTKDEFIKTFETSYRPEVTCLETITCNKIDYCIHRQGFP